MKSIDPDVHLLACYVVRQGVLTPTVGARDSASVVAEVTGPGGKKKTGCERSAEAWRLT